MIKRPLISLILILLLLPSVGMSASYYFADDGTDDGGSNPCTDWQAPCLTYARAEALWAGASTDDKFLFAEGDTWTVTSRIQVDTAGIIIGAFNKAVSGTEITTNSTNKPIFTGAGVYPTSAQSLPRSLFYMTVDNATIRNLEIVDGHADLDADDVGWVEEDEDTYGDEGGPGVQIGSNVDYATIQYCKIHGMWLGGISAGSTTTYATIDSNELYNNSVWYRETEKYTPYITSGWAPNISLISCANCTATNNYIYSSFGEGINIGNSNIADANIISDTSSAGIYSNGTDDSTIKNNLIIGTTDTTFKKHDFTHHGSSIVIGNEVGFGNTSNIAVYNNIIINNNEGIRLKAATALTVNDVRIYSNTFIDNNWNLRINNGSQIGQSTPIIFRNNISLCTDNGSNDGTGQIGDGCTHWQDSDAGVGITVSNNLWYGDDDQAGTWNYTTDLTAAFKGSGDVTTTPLLNLMTGYTVFSAYTDLTMPTDVTPLAGGNAIDAGYTLGSPYNVDYSGTTRLVDLYDIGAQEYEGSADCNAVVSQTELDSYTGHMYLNGNSYGQSFVANSSVTSGSVNVTYYSGGAVIGGGETTPTGDDYIRIANSLDMTTYVCQSSAFEIGAATGVRIETLTGCTLVNGQTYYLGFVQTAGDANNYVTLGQYSASDAYADGVKITGPGTWVFGYPSKILVSSGAISISSGALSMNSIGDRADLYFGVEICAP